MKTPEEKRLAQRAATKRWLNKPGNREKHHAAVKRCRQQSEAKETHRKRQLAYASKNRLQEKARAAKWRKDFPEKARELDRRKYLKAKDAVLEYNRRYRKEHPGIISFWRKNRKGRKRASGGRITRKFVLNLFVIQNGKCLACKTEFAESGYQIDHVIPLSKGGKHLNSNVQLLCPTCNKRKSAREMDEFLKILEAEIGKR
jgi:5-methylcytosine-specific restriction endonuclease McrA